MRAMIWLLAIASGERDVPETPGRKALRDHAARLFGEATAQSVENMTPADWRALNERFATAAQSPRMAKADANVAVAVATAWADQLEDIAASVRNEGLRNSPATHETWDAWEDAADANRLLAALAEAAAAADAIVAARAARVSRMAADLENGDGGTNLENEHDIPPRNETICNRTVASGTSGLSACMDTADRLCMNARAVGLPNGSSLGCDFVMAYARWVPKHVTVDLLDYDAGEHFATLLDLEEDEFRAKLEAVHIPETPKGPTQRASIRGVAAALALKELRVFSSLNSGGTLSHRNGGPADGRHYTGALDIRAALPGHVGGAAMRAVAIERGVRTLDMNNVREVAKITRGQDKNGDGKLSFEERRVALMDAMLVSELRQPHTTSDAWKDEV